MTGMHQQPDDDKSGMKARQYQSDRCSRAMIVRHRQSANISQIDAAGR